mmetsp:Transcript_10178/g.10504  ORF Transcript_10178/g.10504 Transcript_10178/m.10504 type:complete len:218 (-) Transcript_10178:1323-1976(-)
MRQNRPRDGRGRYILEIVNGANDILDLIGKIIHLLPVLIAVFYILNSTNLLSFLKNGFDLIQSVGKTNPEQKVIPQLQEHPYYKSYMGSTNYQDEELDEEYNERRHSQRSSNQRNNNQKNNQRRDSHRHNNQGFNQEYKHEQDQHQKQRNNHEPIHINNEQDDIRCEQGNFQSNINEQSNTQGQNKKTGKGIFEGPADRRETDHTTPKKGKNTNLPG